MADDMPNPILGIRKLQFEIATQKAAVTKCTFDLMEIADRIDRIEKNKAAHYAAIEKMKKNLDLMIEAHGDPDNTGGD